MQDICVIFGHWSQGAHFDMHINVYLPLGL